MSDLRKPCPSCEHLVSPKAKACPECGEPIATTWFTYVFNTVGITLLLLYAMYQAGAMNQRQLFMIEIIAKKDKITDQDPAVNSTGSFFMYKVNVGSLLRIKKEG